MASSLALDAASSGKGMQGNDVAPVTVVVAVLWSTLECYGNGQDNKATVDEQREQSVLLLPHLWSLSINDDPQHCDCDCGDIDGAQFTVTSSAIRLPLPSDALSDVLPINCPLITMTTDERKGKRKSRKKRQSSCKQERSFAVALKSTALDYSK